MILAGCLLRCIVSSVWNAVETRVASVSILVVRRIIREYLTTTAVLSRKLCLLPF